MKQSKIGILTGPTATGKSQIAFDFAMRKKGIELINADSLLVYRHLNIGTAKPPLSQLQEVPHHLIDILDPSENFTAGEFVRRAHSAIQEIISRGHQPLIVGGTGFYLKALLFGIWEAPATHPELRKKLEKESNASLHDQVQKIDPKAAQRIGPTDRYRLIRTLEIFQVSGQTPSQLESKMAPEADPRFTLWVIDRDSSELHQRIQKRTQLMLEEGLVEEFKMAQSQFPESRALQAIGYAQVAAYLKGQAPAGRKLKAGIEGLQEEIELATRQLVKSQRTWFNGFCKKAVNSKKMILAQDEALLREEMEKLYD
jgi:tRNA dimethylallyltransferase